MGPFFHFLNSRRPTMSTEYNWETIQIDLMYKDDKVLVIHGNDPSLAIELSINKTRTGGKNVIIPINIFSKEHILPIDMFEREISNRLTLEQEVILYNSWGKALSIVTSSTAILLGIEKSLAKEIIALGGRHDILYQGNNNTWKIKDANIIKERWRDKAKQLSSPTVEKKPVSISEAIKEMHDRFDKPPTEKEPKKESLREAVERNKQEMDEMSISIKKEKELEEKIAPRVRKQSVRGGIKEVFPEELEERKKQREKEKEKERRARQHPMQDSSVIEDLSEKGLQKKLKDLIHRKDNFTGWNENCTVHDVVDQINATKRSLQIFENIRASEVYKQQQSTPGFHIVTETGQKAMPMSQTRPQGKTQKLTKKKP